MFFYVINELKFKRAVIKRQHFLRHTDSTVTVWIMEDIEQKDYTWLLESELEKG